MKKMNVTFIFTLMTVMTLISCSVKDSRDDLIFEEVNFAQTGNSLQAFEATLYPILQQNCKSCHGSTQSPKFAVSDISISHETLISLLLVDLQSPSSSRLVQKIQGGHQSFNSQLASQIEDALVSWNSQLGSENFPTTPQLQATFSSIHQLILVPKCLGCHSPDGIRPQEDYRDYNTTLSTGKITAGDPQDSEMYKECVDGEMPLNSTSLTIQELDIIRDWILLGAENN
jgi:cytochrome c553